MMEPNFNQQEGFLNFLGWTTENIDAWFFTTNNFRGKLITNRTLRLIRLLVDKSQFELAYFVMVESMDSESFLKKAIYKWGISRLEEEIRNKGIRRASLEFMSIVENEFNQAEEECTENDQ